MYSLQWCEFHMWQQFEFNSVMGFDNRVKTCAKHKHIPPKMSHPWRTSRTVTMDQPFSIDRYFHAITNWFIALNHNHNQMLTHQWSRIYWNQMKCVQFYLFSLFVWWEIFVAVCLIVEIIKAPTEVVMRISIALESTLLAWWLTHLFLTTSVTWL